MNRRRRSYITTEVEVDIECLVDSLDGEELVEIVKDAGYDVRPLGDGDSARAENLIERAYLAVRRMADVPAEVRDLFWHVHGRAI